MAERFQAPRGTRDILPAEEPLWQGTIVAAMTELARLYGYGRIQTPGFEDTALFARTAGQASDVVQKEMYTFADRSGRSLTLRPEGTAPICRAYVEHGMHREPQPVKLHTLAPMYRYSAPQKGRYREHWQWSVEAIGSADPAVDAELIQLYQALLARVGVGHVELRLNSIGDAACRPAYLERLEAWLDAHEDLLDAEAQLKRRTSPLQVFDVKNEALQAALAGAPRIGEALCGPCREHLEAVRGYLEALRVPYTLEPSLVRGLDYYTRTTFEFVHADLGLSICGGGRYDGLVEEIGGPPTPGIGFGAGIDRLALAATAEGLSPAAPVPAVFFIVEGGERAAVLELMAELRGEGVACDTDYAGRSARGQWTQAKRSGAGIIVRAREEDAVLVRAGEERVVAPAELGARLRAWLA
jgi:histidyl-tRNA synthetase